VDIGPGGSETFTVTYDSTDIGQFESSISVYSNDPDDNPFTFSVRGEAALPDIGVVKAGTPIDNGSPNGHDFGPVLEYNTSQPVTFTIENSGTAALSIETMSFVSGDLSDFSYDDGSTSPSVLPGESTTLDLFFSPTVTGSRSATFSIENDDPDGDPYTFTVWGYGETPIPVIDVFHETTHLPNGSGVYYFGHVQEGDSETQTFTIENDGTAQLIISGILLTDGYTDQFNIDFSIPPIAPGGSDTFAISFEPTVSGDKWATVTIVNNDPSNDPFTFRVEGSVGLPPVVNIDVRESGLSYPDGSTYDGFGTVEVGSSSGPVMFYIWNNGPDTLVIPNIVMTGGDILDFDLDLNSTDLNVPIPPGGFTVFTVTFIPSSDGTRWLDLSINYNDPLQSPYMLRLEGVGDD
jgi:hypothetical protein